MLKTGIWRRIGAMDHIQSTRLVASQLRSKPHFEVKVHQIPIVYAGLVGAVGIEPTTFGLKGRCSTTELRPYGVNSQV